MVSAISAGLVVIEPDLGTSALLLLVVAAMAGSGLSRSGEPETLPYTLSIRVGYGEPAGPTSVSDEVERLTLHHIESREWFEDVRILGPDEEDED